MALPATLLLTRPRAASERFAQQLIARFGPVDVEIAPLMEITFRDISDAEIPSAIIFTSRNGVAAWAHAGLVTNIPCYCVGAATGAAARALGFEVFTSGGTVEHLIGDLKTMRPNGTLLHLRGQHSRGDLAAHLSKDGMTAKEIIAYDQQLLSLSQNARALLEGGERVIVPLFSPRSAAHFASLGPFGSQVELIAISKAAAQSCQGAHVAPNPDAEGMLSAIAEILIA